MPPSKRERRIADLNRETYKQNAAFIDGTIANGEKTLAAMKALKASGDHDAFLKVLDGPSVKQAIFDMERLRGFFFSWWMQSGENATREAEEAAKAAEAEAQRLTAEAAAKELRRHKIAEHRALEAEFGPITVTESRDGAAGDA